MHTQPCSKKFHGSNNLNRVVKLCPSSGNYCVGDNTIVLCVLDSVPTSFSVIQQEKPFILERLRSETRLEHERLENDLNLLRTDLTYSSYCQILERFYGFYFPWEQKLSARLPVSLPLDFEARRKTPKLVSDLRFLGSDPNALPLCADLPNLRTLPELLGGMYVTEGATLGGQLISRHLERTLNLQDGLGYAFFSSYGPNVGQMWREFRQLLVSVIEPVFENETVVGAKNTFDSIYKWLCGGGRP